MSLAIRKVQFAPSKVGRQPCTVVRKDFMLSPGELELEVVLDKQVIINNMQPDEFGPGHITIKDIKGHVMLHIVHHFEYNFNNR